MRRIVNGKVVFCACLIVICSAMFANAQTDAQGAFPPVIVGNPGAPNQIEIYQDYQCPASAFFFKKLTELVESRPNEVAVTFRNFPLAGHSNAWPAARAAEAAAAQGKFVEMSRLIFESQDKWRSRDDAAFMFRDFGASLNLDARSYGVNIESQNVTYRILQDIERGKSLNVNGTPWMLLNGRPMPSGEAIEVEKFLVTTTTN